MTGQPSQKADTPRDSVRPTLGTHFLRGLLGLSLILYAFFMVDLVLHPLGAGIGVSGFSLDAATAERYIAAFIGTGTIALGIFIMRRVHGNSIGPLLIIWGAGYTGYEIRVDYGSPLLTSLMHLIFLFYSNCLAFPALFILILIFPTGKVYPLWAKRPVTVYVVLYVIVGMLGLMAQSPTNPVSELGAVSLPMNPFFVPALAPYYSFINNAVDNILGLLGLVAAVVLLILRYRAAQTHERQQIKWFIWVTCMVLILFIPDVLTPNGTPLLSPLMVVYLMFFYGLLGAFPAIAIGLGILRSRLWGIDIIINRTLVYGSLTALLGLLYFGLIFGLQFLFQGFVGKNNSVAIVISTLAIAALFQPLRHRLQRIVDRRFYRSKYDAAKIIESFSVTLRNEVELNQLSEHLVAVVKETMQPTYVSLWLRKPGKVEDQSMQAGNPSSS